MDALAFPVYVLGKDDGHVIEFPNLFAMQGYLEPIDVENDEYESWDARGIQVTLSVGKSRAEWLNIRLTENTLSETEFATIRQKSEKYEKPISLKGWIGALLKRKGAS